MSVAFTKEDSAETASETLLPDRPVSPHPNLVTEAGLKALESQLAQAREDGRVQKYRIVGEDEADPKAGSISFVAPVARMLMGKAVGDAVEASGQELEIIAID